ncbi:MAG: N-acetyltransferase family protein [Gemmatimonadota bacterium]
MPEAVTGDALLQFAVTAAVTIRPQNTDDGELLADFVRGLSAASRYQRFHAVIGELSAPLLERLTRIEAPQEMALLATTARRGREIVLGEVRYGAADDAPEARDIALAVGDAWQRVGIGARLLGELLRRAGEAGVRRVTGDVFAANAPMLALARRFGFAQRRHPSDARLVRVERSLASAGPRLEVST